MPRKRRDSPPDAPTQAAAEEIVNPGVNPAVAHTTPDKSLPFPIVAVGASAGGIGAIRMMLEALATDTGMAFVIVQHLSPTHGSMLTEILGRATRMPVAEATDKLAVEPNHVYVIPPGKDLLFGNGVLQLAPRTELRGVARPIDHFMRSLAEEQGHKAIGVVLSGTANDGTLGVQEIKSAGGITFAQDSTAEQASMPRSAIAAGAVDFVLPPDEIARELLRISRHPYVAPAEIDPSAANEPAFQRVLDALRQATGVDFASYKRNTLHRRITRRMVLHKLDGLLEYVKFMQAHPAELEALYQDVLINVTSFFRNADAYDALKTVVFPRITAERNHHEPVRVWALGCSTGEEAYSLAMCYTEFAEANSVRVPMQVFATDVNGIGIDRARAAVYPKGIVQDVSPERLRRFFVDADGSFQVTKQIRDMCVFARQNAVADPPFSRLDLVACRNLLIYFEPVLQQRLIPLLHYALRPDGYLWLGGSETIGVHRDLFELADAKHKIYLRKPSKRAPAPPLAAERMRVSAESERATAPPPRDFAAPDPQKDAERLLLARYAPAGVLVNGDLEVLQFRGDTGPYLAPAPGRASLSLIKMLREGLLVPVRGAITRAKRGKTAVREEGLRVRANGGWREVDVVVLPVRASASTEGTYLVLFEEPANRAEARARAFTAEAAAAAEKAPPPDEDSTKEQARLKHELEATREYLQSVIEQQEAANEELQSANEEIQSANEELQSINEELETSKEEIQSANEELATVNDELQNRNVELSQSNNDLTNLLASVNTAIVMLGPDLRIRRFTQPAEKLLNLIHADVGRPMRDLKLGIEVPDFEAMIAEVIETVAMRELEVQDRNHRWYLLRVRPYRTSDNKIDGAVLMLVDIDNLKRAEQSLRESEERFQVLANSAPVLIWVNDLDGSSFVNRAFEQFTGASEADIRRLGVDAFVHPDERQAYADAYAAANRLHQPFETRTRLRRGDGDYRWMKVVAMPRFIEGGRLLGYVGSAVDITDLADAEAALVDLDHGRNEFLAMLAHELRNPLAGVSNASRLLEEPRDAETTRRARAIIERQTANMVRMVDDLLDVSRMTYGKIRLQMEPVDIVGVAQRAIEVSGPDRDALGQKLAARLPAEALYVNGDPVRLDQVFNNLLGNASKFTPRGGQIWLDLEREAPAGRPVIAVRVSDEGAGIDVSLLPRVFDLFVQGDGTAARGRGGFGLGLTLAKRLVEMHGGTIEAQSLGEGRGSTFTVRLPLLEETPKPAPKPRARRAAAAPRKVLIVDDNRDSAESLRLLLAASGHDMRVVRRGADVLNEAAAFKPSMVLLDISLPDMDGYSVAKALRADARTADFLLVALTGYGRDVDRDKAAKAGFDLHLTKPVDPDTLMDALERGRRDAKA